MAVGQIGFGWFQSADSRFHFPVPMDGCFGGIPDTDQIFFGGVCDGEMLPEGSDVERSVGSPSLLEPIAFHEEASDVGRFPFGLFDDFTDGMTRRAVKVFVNVDKCTPVYFMARLIDKIFV